MNRHNVDQLVHDYRNAVWCYESFSHTGRFVESEQHKTKMISIMVDLEFAALVLGRHDQLKALRRRRAEVVMTDLQYVEAVALLATDELPPPPLRKDVE